MLVHLKVCFFCVYLYACVGLHILPPHKFPWEVTVEKSLLREVKSALIKTKIKQQTWRIFTHQTFFCTHTHWISEACVILREYKCQGGNMLVACSHWDTDRDIWQVYGGCICGVMRGERVSRTWMHWSMAVCLLTHNTGIAQSSPWPIFVRHAQKSIFCTFHALKKKKKKGESQTFRYSLWWKLKAYPFKFEEKHFRK